MLVSPSSTNPSVTTTAIIEECWLWPPALMASLVSFFTKLYRVCYLDVSSYHGDEDISLALSFPDICSSSPGSPENSPSGRSSNLSLSIIFGKLGHHRRQLKAHFLPGPGLHYLRPVTQHGVSHLRETFTAPFLCHVFPWKELMYTTALFLATSSLLISPGNLTNPR